MVCFVVTFCYSSFYCLKPATDSIDLPDFVLSLNRSYHYWTELLDAETTTTQATEANKTSSIQLSVREF